MESGEIDGIRRHIASRLRRAVLELSPFPHLTLAEFFPDDVYARIQRLNPFTAVPGTEWLPRDASRNVSARTPYHARKQIDLRAPEAIEDAEVRAFWTGVRDALLDGDWFTRLVTELFPSYFRLRFGDLVDDADFFALMTTQLFLQRHEPGFVIGPHTDLPTRIFTCIFSFAPSDGYERYGTQLLAHKDRLVRCWGTDHHAPNDFEVRSVVPYRPNGFLLFFKTRHSFHSVAAVDEHVPNQRYGMQLQFHEPPNGVFRDLSAPELFAFPRPVT